MMSRSEDNFWSGLKVLFFLLGMLIVFGTVGHVEMTDHVDWLQVVLNGGLGLLMMWYGSKVIKLI